MIKKVENIFVVALDHDPDDPLPVQRSGPNHVSTAKDQFKLDVESTALIRAAEEIMVLTRTMKELWLFGGLDTLEVQDGDGEQEKGARPDDLKAVSKYLQEYIKAQNEVMGSPEIAERVGL